MTTIARGSLVWAGMILAGLTLGAYVLAAWPDTTSQPKAQTKAQPVGTTASVDTSDSELAGVAGAVYPGDLFLYEPGPAPLLDALIGAPQAFDAS